jgi:hypothetical protein
MPASTGYQFVQSVSMLTKREQPTCQKPNEASSKDRFNLPNPEPNGIMLPNSHDQMLRPSALQRYAPLKDSAMK